VHLANGVKGLGRAGAGAGVAAGPFPGPARRPGERLSRSSWNFGDSSPGRHGYSIETMEIHLLNRPQIVHTR
jgi:hypothetical protein